MSLQAPMMIIGLKNPYLSEVFEQSRASDAFSCCNHNLTLDLLGQPSHILIVPSFLAI
jgi:hypothetical protein